MFTLKWNQTCSRWSEIRHVHAELKSDMFMLKWNWTCSRWSKIRHVHAGLLRCEFLLNSLICSYIRRRTWMGSTSLHLKAIYIQQQQQQQQQQQALYFLCSALRSLKWLLTGLWLSLTEPRSVLVGKKQGRIHGNPIADGWAGAVMRKPLAIQKCD